jgi:hypothetical protein
MAFSSAIDVLDIISSCLKVTGSIVALGNEDVVVDTTLKRLIKRDWWALDQVS